MCNFSLLIFNTSRIEVLPKTDDTATTDHKTKDWILGLHAKGLVGGFMHGWPL